jgi:hypothetical protein
MSNFCHNSLRIIGTHEAVAEVAMFLCQDHQVTVTKAAHGIEQSAAYVIVGTDAAVSLPDDREVADAVAWNFDSFGIRMAPRAGEPDVGHCELAATFTTDFDKPDRLLEQLSRRFPDVVVGEVYDEPLNAVWGVVAYLNGTRVLDLDDFPVDAEWKARYDDADEEQAQAMETELDAARDVFGIERLRTVAGEKLAARAAARAADIPASLRHHGWPRWSLLAHAANADGAEGLRDALAQLTTGDQMHSALTAEIAAAEELGVASWVDTTLFGDAAAPAETDIAADESAGGAYAVLALDAFRDRHCNLLQLLSQAPTDPLAQALLASLSDPHTRLTCGLHPAAFLAASAAAAVADGSAHPEATRGLDELLSKLAARTPRVAEAPRLGQMEPEGRVVAKYPLLRSMLAVAAVGRACPSQLKPAMAAGVTPDFLLRTLLAAPEGSGGSPQVLERMHDVYGAFDHFPAGLVDEIAAVGPGFRATFEALRTAENMRSRISAAAPEAKPAPRRSPVAPWLLTPHRS